MSDAEMAFYVLMRHQETSHLLRYRK